MFIVIKSFYKFGVCIIKIAVPLSELNKRIKKTVIKKITKGNVKVRHTSGSNNI